MVALIGRAVVQGVKNTPPQMMPRCQSPTPGGMLPTFHQMLASNQARSSINGAAGPCEHPSSGHAC